MTLETRDVMPAAQPHNPGFAGFPAFPAPPSHHHPHIALHRELAPLLPTAVTLAREPLCVRAIRTALPAGPDGRRCGASRAMRIQAALKAHVAATVQPTPR